ncbi:MAG: LacI family DNA-binding transcriptional regulator [Granulosicoccus sp.]|nr:LacI family DNA-binding transcriptional regulator [Granulosicoccus sp.]
MPLDEATSRSTGRSRRPTLRTVAEASGLAVTTVSRALNDGEDIALATRQRVKRIASELGYVPNRAGLGLRTGRTHVLSLLISPHAEISSYTASIISGLSEVCRNQGYEMSASPDSPNVDELASVRSVVDNHRADGIVLSRTGPQDLRVRYLLEHRIPFVTHGRTELATPHAAVDFDNQGFAEQATARLISHDRSRLMLIGPAPGLTYHNHMRIGFERVVTRASVIQVEAPGGYAGLHLESPLDELRRSICRLCRSTGRPDGIICGGELAALATLAGIRDAGLLPGREIEVVAKQTSPALDYTYPPIDSWFEDIYETGQLLGEMLLHVINGDQAVADLTQVVQPQPRFRRTP